MNEVATCTHTDYVSGCHSCFEEAVDGGLIHWLRTEMHGVDERRMPSAPGTAVFELSFEGVRLFTAQYQAEGDGIAVPDLAQARIDELIAGEDALLEAARDRIDAAVEAEDRDGQHRAMQAEGRHGGRVAQMRAWQLPARTEGTA